MFWKKEYEEKLFNMLKSEFDGFGESLIMNWVFYQLKWYSSGAQKYRLYSRIYTGLSLASPAFASLGISISEWKGLKYVILTVNAAFIVAIGIFASMRCTEQWIRYRTVCEKLKRLTVDYLYSAKNWETEIEKRKAGSEFLSRIDVLIGEELDEWSRLTLEQIREERERQKSVSEDTKKK